MQVCCVLLSLLVWIRDKEKNRWWVFLFLFKLTAKYSTENVDFFSERSTTKSLSFSCFLETDF